MKKERLEGLNLQVSAIFARLDAIKQSLPKDSLEKYIQLIEQKKQSWREECDINNEQLDEWLQ